MGEPKAVDFRPRWMDGMTEEDAVLMDCPAVGGDPAAAVTVGDWLGSWVARHAAKAAGTRPSETLSMRVRRLRRAAGLSMRDVAERTGFSIAAQSQVERGRTLNPEVATVLKLARLYGLSVEQLMEGVD